MSQKDDYTVSPSKAKKKSFSSFIWNKQTKQFLGRTGSSWAKIGLFYLVFYSCLAAFFAIMLVVFLQTLDSRHPTWMLDASRIGSSPGMAVIPRQTEENIASTLIKFRHGQNGDWQHWYKSVDDFIKLFEGRDVISSGTSINCDNTTKENDDQTCHFDVDRYMENSRCNRKRKYGYRYGQPCIIVKLNRIFGWEPEPYDIGDLPEEMPEKLKREYNPNTVPISCEGENPADKENIGELEYSPKAGVDSYFYPFKNEERYEAPFVFVEFKSPNKGILINVECRVWAKNVNYNRQNKQGCVHFELLVD